MCKTTNIQIKRLHTGWAAARLERIGRLRQLINVKFWPLWIKMTIIIFVHKIMHNFQIGYNFFKQFFKSNLYSGRILCKSVKSDIILKKINRVLRSATQGWIHRDLIKKKKKSNNITQFKFWLSLYPLLILTRTPFK